MFNKTILSVATFLIAFVFSIPGYSQDTINASLTSETFPAPVGPKRLVFDSFQNRKFLAIVQIGRGTGLFVGECYLLTAMHVLEPRLVKDRNFLKNQKDPKDQTMINRKFGFKTQKLSDGHAIKGNAIVVAEGEYNTDQSINYHRANDIAVLEDPDCTGRNPEIGHYFIMDDTRLLELKLAGFDLMVAGFPYVEGSRADGHTLVIDPKCRETVQIRRDLSLTNCFGRSGSSGQPVFRINLKDPTSNILPVYGITIAGENIANLEDNNTAVLSFYGLFERFPRFTKYLREEDSNSLISADRPVSGTSNGSNYQSSARLVLSGQTHSAQNTKSDKE